MSEAYVGEIRWFPYVRGAPVNWLLCNGSQLSISEYQTLYALIGTTYGGNGQTTFQLPDLRGRVPLHQGQGLGLSPRPIGLVGGTENVTLLANQAGGHTHVMQALTTPATTQDPSNALFAATDNGEHFYLATGPGQSSTPLATPTIGSSGQTLPHENCAPTLALQACICAFGIFPSQQ